MNTKLPILIMLTCLVFACSNSSSSDITGSGSGATNTTITATSKGCTVAQIAFRIKNSTASSRDSAIDTGTTCAGTTTNGNPLTLTAGATGNYVCATAGTYYGRTLTAVGGTESCSNSAFALSANAVYTISINSIAGSVMTASVAQD